MANYTRKQILDEAKKLSEMLSQTEEVDHFKELEAKMNNDEKIQRLIERIKLMQEQMTKFQERGKTKALQKANEEIDRLQDELDSYQIVQEFKETQKAVDDVIQLVSGTIAREVTNNIITSTGGDLLSGETGKEIQDGSMNSQ